MIKKFKSQRDRLYYDQFEWCFSFRCKSINLLRGADEKTLQSRIDYRNRLWKHDTFVKEDVDNLYQMLGIIKLIPKPHRIYYSYHWVYIYHSDVAMLENLIPPNDFDFVSQKQITQAVVCKPRDIVVKSNPKYQYRTYLRESLIRDETKSRSLSSFLKSRDDWALSGSLLRDCEDLTNGVMYVRRHHFIEHNSLQDLLLLGLHTPGLIRKTMPIQAK